MLTRMKWHDLEVVSSVGDLPDEVTGLTQNSQDVKAGYAFLARSGEKVNGLDFVEAAADKGASVVITQDTLPDNLPIPGIQVEDIKVALVKLAHELNGNPSQKLRIIGLTGTKGKSSSAYIIQSILSSAGKKSGLIGTIEYETGKQKIRSTLTTPQIDTLCSLWNEMLEAGCEYCVMEVSSHALSLGRVDGTHFVVGAFTNLSHEHLDFHKSMEDYIEAKSLLLKMLPKNGLAVVNAGDIYGQFMIEEANSEFVTTFGNSQSWADFTTHTVKHNFNGGIFRIDSNYGSFEVTTPLIGIFHGENIALSAAVTMGLGLGVDDVINGVKALKAVPGRMEPVNHGQPFSVFVDFAHAPDPLERALKSLKNICDRDLVVIFGCGGDRDTIKRPIMGKIAAELADRVIVTSDNSRTEEPNSIIQMICEGIAPEQLYKVTREVDRRKAIEKAVGNANSNDILMIAGKGHEPYQEEYGVKHSFDDRLIAAEALNKLGWIKRETDQ